MSPDLEHIIRLSPVSYYGHSLIGLFFFCIPVGCIFLVLYEIFWKQPLSEIFKEMDFSSSKSSAFKIISSLLIGASSHLGWDSLSHKGRLGADFLEKELFFFAGVNFNANLFQHLSTVFGAWVIVSFFINAGVARIKVLRLTVFQALLYLNLYFVNFHSNSFFSASHIVHTANDLLILNLILLTALGVVLKNTKDLSGLREFMENVLNGRSLPDKAVSQGR